MAQRAGVKRFTLWIVVACWVSPALAQTSPVTHWVQCENYSASQGVALAPQKVGEPRLGVDNCSNGNWLRYDSLNFMNGELDSIYFDCWTNWELPGDHIWPEPGERVVIRLDSPTGSILATVTLGSTMCKGYGASDRFKAAIAKTTGIHNVHLVFEGTGPVCIADKFCLLGTAQANPNEARTYYVAPYGIDGNDGLSAASPFKTVQRAASLMKPGSTCLIRQGVYREVIKPVYTGLAGAPLTFKAYGNERVVFSGGDSVTGWTQHSGNIYKANIGWSMGKYKNQLLVNGQDAIVARSPNIDDPYTAPAGYEGMPPGGIWNNTSRWHNEVSPLLLPARVQMWMQYDDAVRNQGLFEILIQQYSSEHWLPTYLLNHPAGYYKGGLLSLRNLWWVNAAEITASSDFTANGVTGVRITARTINDPNGANCCSGQGFISYLLPLLDQPNEWFFDTSTGTVYLWAPDGGNPSHHLVEAKRRMVSIDLTGKQYVTLKGLWFLSTAITLRDAFYCTIDDCHFKYPSYFDSYKWWEEYGGAGGATFDASDGLHGVYIGGGHNVVQNSSSQISSGSGFNIDGKFQTVKNCIIHDVCLLPTYDAGIRQCKRDAFDDSPEGAGLLITNNTIFNCGRAGIEIDGDGDAGIDRSQRCRISYNDISRTGLNSHESTSIGLFNGVQYLEIDHNWFHAVSNGGQGYLGTDPAAGCGAMNIHHNVFFKGRPIYDQPDNGAVGFHWVVGEGDSALRVINNTCVDSTQPGGARHWDLYPMQTFPAKCFVNNIYGMSDTGRWKYTDPAHYDYTLRAESPAVDSGIFVQGYTDDVTDGKPDLGAYERGKTPWRAGADWQEKAWVYPPPPTSAVASWVRPSAVFLRPYIAITPQRFVVTAPTRVAYTIRLFDALGHVRLAVRKDKGGMWEMKTAQTPAGVYFVKVSSASESLVQRAVVRR